MMTTIEVPLHFGVNSKISILDETDDKIEIFLIYSQVTGDLDGAVQIFRIMDINQSRSPS